MYSEELTLYQTSPGFYGSVVQVLKTLCEKEKLLVTSNFSFSHSVFYPFRELFPHFHQIQNCCLQLRSVWKGLKFVVLSVVQVLKTLWEKEKLLLTSNFSFAHSVFYPFRKLSPIFIKFKIVVCNFFQFGRS